jgi:hypothetical protein
MSANISETEKLWLQLPRGFLKKAYGGWVRLDYGVQQLVVQLANKQGFKCAHCSRTGGLEIEHEHYPEEGCGKRLTIYNIRGLVCRSCNNDLSIYEKDARGEYRGFDNYDSSFISDQDYEIYIHEYECRVSPLLEALREGRMGSRNYWNRRAFLWKLDDWEEWGAPYPWRWGFEEIKEKRHGRIRTPSQFLRILTECMKFFAIKIESNPDFQPPKSFVKLMMSLKPIMDEIKPVIEGRLRVIDAQEARNVAS